MRSVEEDELSFSTVDLHAERFVCEQLIDRLAWEVEFNESFKRALRVQATTQLWRLLYQPTYTHTHPATTLDSLRRDVYCYLGRWLLKDTRLSRRLLAYLERRWPVRLQTTTVHARAYFAGQLPVVQGGRDWLTVWIKPR